MMNFVGISNSTAAKMTNKEPVSINVLEKVCEKLNCYFGNIVHYEKEKKAVYNSGIQCRACIKAVLASRIQKGVANYILQKLHEKGSGNFGKKYTPTEKLEYIV